MSNFVSDTPAQTLAAAKSDLIDLQDGADPTKYVVAADWNQFRSALIDIQSFLRGDIQLFKATDPTKTAKIMVVTASPNGTVTGLKGSIGVDVTNAKLYQNTDGASAWSQFSFVGAGSSTLSIVQTQSGSDFDNPQTVTPDVEGDIDWFVPGSGPNESATWVPIYSGAISCWEKLLGPGLIRRGLRIIRGAQNVSIGSASKGWKRNISAANSTDGALVDDQNTPYLSGAEPQVGFGWGIVVPSGPTQQVLRIYSALNSCMMTIKAHLIDGSIADATTSYTTAAPTSGGTSLQFPELRHVITFSSPQATWLSITMIVTANTFSPSWSQQGTIGLAAITLASS